jgi:hypothetical protein
MRVMSGRIVGLVIAASVGILPSLVAATGPLPGDGRFIPAAIAAGVVALVAAPGWAGLAAVLGGMLVGQLLTIGIVQFSTAVLAVLISYGAVVGVAVGRILRAPHPPWWRNRVTWAWFGTAIAGGIALAWLAIDMARNPF